MKRIHSRLMEGNGSYADWHSDPVHKPLHWLSFLAVMVLVVISINRNYPESSANLATSNNPTTVSEVAINKKSEKITGQYIIKFKDGVRDPKGLAEQLTRENNGQLLFVYGNAIKGFAAKIPDAALNGLRNNPNVEYVEQDQTVHVATSQYQATWGLDRIDQTNSLLNSTYNYNATGAGVHVYVIDTGVRSTHSEFSGRMGNGFTTVNDGWGTDGCHWHGTHVAGTIGGTVYGVAKEATIHPVRVLDCTGNGYNSDLIASIDWVITNKINPAIINMSLSGSLSQVLNTAIKNAVNSGITTVVAAGNNSLDACNFSPASEISAITIAATTNTDSQASYSNWGNCVDIYAPGSGVTSAWNTDDSSIGTASGTSMATPHAVGVAALYLEKNPLATVAEVTNAIKIVGTSNVITSVVGSTPNLLLYSLVNGEIAPLPTVSLSVNPTSIVAGQSSTLTWSTTNATSCTAGGGWTGTKAISGTQTVTPATTTTYTLSCTGSGGEMNKSTTVTVTASSGIQIGSKVTTTAKVNVRSTPSLAGKILGQQSRGKTGVITAGPTSADGYTWWNVNFTSGVDGWTTGNYLK